MFRSLFDRLWRILAEAVPARLVYFIALRVLHEAVDEFHADVPPRLIPFLEALGTWKETKLLKRLPEDLNLDTLAPVAARASASAPIFSREAVYDPVGPIVARTTDRGTRTPESYRQQAEEIIADAPARQFELEQRAEEAAERERQRRADSVTDHGQGVSFTRA